MQIKIVIAGCRDYNNYPEAKAYLDSCITAMPENEYIILCGGCRGADMLGARYAMEKGFKVEYYPAHWERYGKSAGLKRNFQMAQACDCVICFWNGKSKGTKSMIEMAKQLSKPIRIKMV